MTTFAVYVLTGHTLTASKAFVALSLFGIMRFPLGFFPDVIASCIQVSTQTLRSTSRITVTPECGSLAEVIDPAVLLFMF